MKRAGASAAEPAERTPFLAGLAANRPATAAAPAWLAARRREAWERFEALGVPTPDLEDWKNTNLAALAKTAFVPATPPAEHPALARLPEPAALELGGPRLVFLDGHFVPALSRTAGSPGVWLGSLVQALAAFPERLEVHLARRPVNQLAAFDALNAACAADGAVLLLSDGARAAAPIHLVYCATGGETPRIAQPRTLLALGPGSQATVVESHIALAAGAYLTNAVTEVELAAGATLRHARLQLEGPAAFHISGLHSRQDRDSRYEAQAIDLGGQLVRHDVHAALAGEGARLNLDGLTRSRATQHVDSHTLIEHASAHCDSRELYKNVLDDRSRTVFNGRIVVRPGAQRTDAKQSNPNLVLSPNALAHTRPQLEIWADDVKCTHGATVGRLDQEALFYLRSRGLGAEAARDLLVDAFLGEVVDRVEPEALRDWLTIAIGPAAGRSPA